MIQIAMSISSTMAISIHIVLRKLAIFSSSAPILRNSLALANSLRARMASPTREAAMFSLFFKRSVKEWMARF